MNLDISLIPYGLLTKTLPQLNGYLSKAAELTDGRSILDDIARMIITGQYTLWTVFDLDKASIVGFFATEVKQYSQCRMLCIHHCVTEPHYFEALEPYFEKTIVSFAKNSGCAGIEFIGRRGWEKYSKKYGYPSYAVMYQRFFKESS